MKYHLTQLQQQLLLTSSLVGGGGGAAATRVGGGRRAHLHRMAEIVQLLWSQSKEM